MKAAYDIRPVNTLVAEKQDAIMRTDRLFTSSTLRVGDETLLDEKAAHYLSRVLRLVKDSEVTLFNGDGNDYRCRLMRLSRESVQLMVLERLANTADSSMRITLSQAMSRGDRMDYCLQKATELGVTQVQLLDSERVELKLSGERLEKRLTHWRGVIQSASEQCGRATLPQLHPPMALHQWLAVPGRQLVLDANAKVSLRQTELSESVNIAVGPEGGFSEDEIESMQRAGVLAVHLGPRILRTESAGPAAITVIQAMVGDLV